MKKLRSILVIFGLILFSLVGHGQTIVEVVTIEKDQGLQDRMVDKIIRDNNGYFFIFLMNTIQKYDGRVFTKVDISAITREGLQVSDIEKVDLLDNGTIVMHTPDLNILYYIDQGSESVNEVPLRGTPIVANSKLYLVRSQSHEERAGDSHLYSADLEGVVSTVQLSDVPIKADIRNIGLVNDDYYLQDSEGKIFYLNESKVTELDVKGMLIQRTNGVYVFGYSAVYKLTGSSIRKVTDLVDRSFECKILKLDKNDNIIAAYQGRPRFFDRLYVLDNNDELHVMDNIIEESPTLKDLYTDDAFCRWMLGGYNGIKVINLLRDGSEIIYKRPKTNKGDFGVVVSGVATDHDEEVIFTKEIQGIFSYDNKTKTFDEILDKPEYISDFERNSKLYYHKPSEAYYSHAYRYDGKSDLYKTSTAEEKMEKHEIPIKLNDIYVSDVDNVLVGGYISKTDNGVLGEFNLKTKTYSVIYECKPQVRSIYFDNETNNYWIGTYGGLVILNSDFKEIARLDKNQSGAQRMFQDHVVMCARYNNHIIASTYGGGVYVIDPLDFTIEKHIDSESGLTDNAAIGVIADDLGYCWITTFNGVNVIDENFNIVRKIYEYDGLPNREFNSKAIAKDGDGVIYAGTLNGLSVLDPKKVMNWQKSYGVDITSILAYTGKSVEKIAISEEAKLLEPYDSIQISYNLPDYHIYPYVEEVLDVTVVTVDGEGLDFTRSDNLITLKNISEGEYFINLSPKGSDKIKTLKVTRRPNYGRYFITLVGFILIGLLAWLISKIIIKNNRKREAEKTNLNKKISDLQLSSLQSQMNPHFIFNALGAVQYFIQTHDTHRADEYLSNFAMLMRSILESSKSKYIRLNEEVRLLELYVGLESVRFEELFEYKIKMDVNVDTEVNIPPMIVQPFVENAINHGLYNLTDRKGDLLIHFMMPEEDKLVIKIIDNGVGREAAAKLRLKKHKSRGTQIVQERIDTINSGHELRIDTETTDLFINGKPAGTQVIVSIESI